MQYSTLNEEQIQHFLDYGYVHLKDCFPKEKARELVDLAYKRLGYDPNDSSTWAEAKVHMPAMNTMQVKEFAPKAYGAMCDLVGGEDRIKDPENVTWGDGFIANFYFGADRPWEPPSPKSGGWHKDGDFFYHFLDSPEQGLLLVVIWQDIGPQGGATYISCDSVKPVAEHLVAHPEGLHPYEGGFGSLIDQCSCFREAMGEAGDVFLLHPYMLHASSQNVSGIPRFMTNPCLTLAEPMNFNREDPDDFSPIELAVLKALGKERLDFQPTAPRREHVPPRVARQRAMLEKEKERLSTTGES